MVGVCQPSPVTAAPAFAEGEVAKLLLLLLLLLLRVCVTATTVCRYPHATATTDTWVARLLKLSPLLVLWLGLWSPPFPLGLLLLLLLLLLALLLLSPPHENKLAGRIIGDG